MSEQSKRKISPANIIFLIISIFVLLTALVSVIVNCSSPKEVSAENGQILAVGSSALQPLVEVAGDEYSNQNPGVFITVQGGGSGQGLSQVSQGAVEIGNSDLFAEEKNIDASHLEDHRIAVVGMGPVVHPDLPIDDITLEQLRDIFTGKITNWKEVGGPDMPVVVINRAAGSGTRATFENVVLQGEKSIQAQEQDNNGTTVRMINETPGSISYLSFSYFNDKTKQLKINGYEPVPENVFDNSWPIWSYEHMYTAKDPDPATAAFMKYMTSDDVQYELVPQLGYISIKDMKVEKDVHGTITEL